METTACEKNLIREIISHLVAGDRKWFVEQAIWVGDMGRFVILNYEPFARNDFNRLVRGMVIEKPDDGWNGDYLDLVGSFPFTRFFNHVEDDADDVDFANSEMLEKLDGTMVGTFFPKGIPNEPYWHTRKMVSLGPSDSNQDGGGKLMPVIDRCVKTLDLTVDDVAFTYIFELLHPTTIVKTRYRRNQFGLYLIGARNLTTHRELTEDQLDQVADRIGARRPRRWDAIVSREEVLRMMKEIGKDTPDFEGFVFRDKATGARVKVKDPDYVKAVQLGGVISYRNLVPKVLQGEDAEIVAYFPAAREKVDLINTRYVEYVERAVEVIKYWRDQKLDRKPLAHRIFQAGEESDFYLRSQIMRLFEEKDDGAIQQQIEQSLMELAIGSETRAGSPGKLVELFGLREVDFS